MMMLFFEKETKKEDTCAHKINKTGTETAPLQVRRSCSRCLSIKTTFQKRVLSWVSQSWGGSLSLEAAMCLPLFLFFSICFMMPMVMMDRQRQIQGVIEGVGEEISCLAYAEYWNNASEGQMADVRRDPFATLEKSYVTARILSQIDPNWIQQVSFQGTEIGANDMVHIEMSYKMKLPFPVFGLKNISVKQVCSRRMWIGSEGGRCGGRQGDEGSQNEEIVYIGKNSARYHRQRTCHYLYNDLETVEADSVKEMRNWMGGRYSPCKRCGSGSSGKTVYVMPCGNSYHTRKDCSAIIAYVQAVPLSEAEHLGSCSYCGGE